MKELAGVFLRLGFTAFGGPAAHIAMMENEFVRRKKWLTREQFLDLVGAASLIPGPSSSEVAIYVGHSRAGWRGLLIAGLCFILPAALIVEAIAWVYVRYQSVPAVGALLYGIKPVIIAIVVQAVWGLSRTAVKSKFLAVLGAAAAAASSLGLNILLLLLAAGAVSIAAAQVGHRRCMNRSLSLVAVGVIAAWPLKMAWAAAPHETRITLSRIFLFFLKVGAIQFGSGYVLLAFLRDDLVTHWHWLTEAQLLDATAVGQFTPGPVFTTATFIGHLLHGPAGAIVATVGIFLPAFLLVAASGAFIPKLRKSPMASAFLDGVNVASLALMAVVTWQLGRASIIDVPTFILAVASAALLLRFKLNSAWLVLGGGAVGVLVRTLGGT